MTKQRTSRWFRNLKFKGLGTNLIKLFFRVPIYLAAGVTAFVGYGAWNAIPWGR